MQKSILVSTAAAFLSFVLLIGSPSRANAQLPKTVRVFKTSTVATAQANFTTTVVAARKAYAQSLDAALKIVMNSGNLEEANALNAVKTSLTAGGDLPAATFKSAGGVQAKSIHDSTVARAKTQYVAALQSAQKTVLAGGDLNEANTIQDELSDILGKAPQTPANASSTAGAGKTANSTPELPPNAVIIEALIDGPSELRVQKNDIYWNNDSNAKPGRQNGKKEPTFVDGVAWQPEWSDPGDRGTDKSKPYTLPKHLDSGLDFKLISVSSKRGDPGIEQRDPIKARGVGSGYSVLIPDSEAGARWYKFAIIPKGSR